MSTELLDSIIANVGSEPTIVSEQHDVDQIDVGTAPPQASLPSVGLQAEIDGLKARGQGGWDEHEYGISWAAQMVKLEKALKKALAFEKTPEGIEKAQKEAEKVITELRNRAKRRASLDTSNGKVSVVVVGEAAWHKLGVNVAGALTAEQAIKLATMDWAVSKRRMSYQFADGTWCGEDLENDTFAIVRDDTQRKLGTVGTRYKPIQNREGFAFLDQVLGQYGGQFHTAGAVDGGSKVWMQCLLPAHAFEVVSGDRVEAFATFTNTHDGTGRAWVYPTTNRIVCANTLNVANRDRRKGLGIKHVGDVNAAVAGAQEALGLAVQEFARFQENAEVMVATKINAEGFFTDLLDAVLDITAADAAKGADALGAILAKSDAERELATKTFQRQIDGRKNLMEDILARYESERCGIGGIRGTKWSAFNAATEHADHYQGGRKVGSEEARLSRRFESVLDGDADAMKQTAYQMVMASKA